MKTAAFAFALLLVAPVALAGGNSKLEGHWVMDRLEGDATYDDAKIDMKVSIDDDDNVVVDGVYERAGKEPKKRAFTYMVDGSEHVVPGDRSADRTVKAKWKGKKLVIEYEHEEDGNLVDVKETWSLKRKQLVIKHVTSLPERNKIITQYFNRMD